MPRWYSLKNDRINDHSILVASCNNAAVENISKELPVGKGMGERFDPEKTLAMESYEKNSVQYPEIYFTYYASNLLEEKNAWGLAAAALGKRKNIRNFYQSVLRPLRWDFYPGKDSVSNRLRRYQEARKAFLKQLALVKKLQEEEAVLCDLALRKMELKSEIQKYPKEDMEARIAAAEKEAERLRQNITEDREQKSVYENQEKEGKQEVTALRQRALDTLQAVGKKPLLFGKKEYQSRFSRAEALVKELEQQAEEAEKKRSGLLEKIKELLDQISQREQELFQKKDALENLYGQKNKQEARVKELEKTSREYKMRCGQQRTGIPLDEELIEGLLSDDKELSTKAQTQNPWFTERYNREREKLFFCALQVNREFILSSRACRDNFTSLAHYWGLQTGDEKERIIFGEEDRRSCVATLYQTLFLLTPVISTTFASVGSFLKDVKQDNAVGLLIVDEAGQAQPQMAAGALYRSRRAVIVGDPKQVEPVVTDDLKLLKRAFDDVRLLPYTSSKTASVQSFADAINAFGASLESPEHPEEPDWVGCPLLVHRRCISPMYEISNTISYGGIMKQKTAPPSPELEETFLFERSQWIQIRGREKGGKNHFVEAQGEKICRMLEEAFSKNEFPSLYIISPFVTVVSGVRACIRAYIKKNASSALAKTKGLEEWMGKNIGTVHTFQGKEANEVMFLLGCDGSREAKGAVAWVNSNIVNVAATRAKYRLYVLGDAKVWAENANLLTVKKILDTYALREIASALENTSLDAESREKAVEQALKCLPPAASFAADSGEEASLDGGEELETESFVQAMADWELFRRPFTEAELQKFKFSGREELENLGEQVKRNLNLAMRLYFFFRPLYAKHKNFDASCCAVLFCKALELQVRERLWTGMKKDLPGCEIRGQGKGRGRISLREARAEELTLGTFRHLIEKNAETLGKRMAESGAPDYAGPWWEAFGKRLASCTQKRNQCCHAGLFTWRELSYLLKDMFLDSGEVPNMKGVFFACGVWEEVGKEE